MSERKYTLEDLRRALERFPDVLAELDWEIENSKAIINLNYEGVSLLTVLNMTLHWSKSRAGSVYWNGIWHDIYNHPEKYEIPVEIPVTDERHPLRGLGYV